MTMYFIFAGSFYYPGGGFQDYRGSVGLESEAEAVIVATRMAYDLGMDWWQLCRLENDRLVLVTTGYKNSQ